MLTKAIIQYGSYQMFIKYSTGQIPPKKSRDKGSQRKKTADDSQETVDASKESKPEPEPVKRKTSSKRRVKKKVTLFAYDSIISDDPGTALELGKSISKTEAEEAEAARQVHATYARIVTEFVPDPTKIIKSSKVTSDPPKKLKGVPYLTLKEQEAADIMLALKERKKTRKRQPGDVNDENDKTESNEDDIYKYKIRVRKDEDEEMINAEVIDSDKGDEEITDAAKEDAKKTSEVKDDPKKAELPPTSSSLSVSSGFGDQFLKLSSDSSLVSTVKDTTDTEINSLLELRVAKLEKDVSDLKKIDLSAEALFALKTQVPSVVDNYLGSKVRDTPTVDLEQGSEKSASEILKIKREQAKKQKMPKFTIKSTDKAALKEYDHKTLIKDENAIDKGVADTVQDHKRKHDDDDDEDPPVRPNQGKQTKRRRNKDLESSKKPSTTKETPKGKAPSKGFKTGKSALAKEPVEEPIDEVVMDDASDDVVHDDNQPQDASEPKTTKTPNQEWFKQPLRPPTPDSEWNKRQVVFDQPEQPWFNQMVSATKDPLTFNDLMATPIDFSKLDWNNLEGDRYLFDLSKPFPLQSHPDHLTVATDYFFNNDLEYLKSSDPKRMYTTSITKTKATQYEIKGIENMGEGRKLWQRSQLNKFSKHNVYSTKKNLRVKSVSVKKLHGYGHLEEIMVKRADRQFYKFKEGDLVDLHLNDIEDMLLLAVQHKLFHLTDSDIVDFIVALHMFTRSIVIKKHVEDLQLGVESYQKKLNIIPPQQTFLEIELNELYTPSHNLLRVIYEDLTKQKRVMRADEMYKFSDGTLKKFRDELHHRIRDFCLEYNTEMPRRKWTAIKRKRSELMVELIDKQMRERRIIRNLERLVGAWELEMDYKLMTRLDVLEPVVILAEVPVTAEEKNNKKNDVNARSLLLMALPNEYQRTFSQYSDAKTMFAAIET
ncbi:hypothetical protein Tco_0752403 [Tanacetum coccineum]|uniref:Uncharacterized protein n=1 Tax=Tanacetum coccineum TaxID=301880 RepID=A0ABQ4Z7N9_9ASTR